MSTQTRILHLVKQGEGIKVEFKKSQSSISKDVYETVCSFSNRFGGEILLGVADNGEIVGVDSDKASQIKKDFVSTINDRENINPPLYLSCTDVEVNEKLVIYIIVPESDQVHTCKKKIYDRNEDGDFDITANTDAVGSLYLRKKQIFSEMKIYPYCQMSDLNEELINLARKRAVIRQPGHPWETLDNMELLKSARLYRKDLQSGEEGFALAAIMLFGKDDTILSVLPYYKTDLIVRKVNLERYDDRDDVRTNLIDSYDRIMKFVEKHLPTPFFLEGTQRMDVRAKVFREVAVNILMHREFNSHFPAKIIFEKGRIIAENGNRPHGFGHIDVNNFSPYPKNPIIAKFFKEIGFAEELGSGIKNITTYYHSFSDKLPEFDENDIFRTRIFTDKIEEEEDVRVADTDEKVPDTSEKPADTSEKPADTLEKPADTLEKPADTISQEKIIIEYVEKNQEIKSTTVEDMFGIKDSRAREILNKMVASQILIKQGKARSTHYILNKK